MKPTKLIIYHFCLILYILFNNTIIGISQTIEVSGNLNQNTTWQADTIKIIGDVFVGEDVRLSIMPSTYIEAQGFYKIQVAGEIWAIGTYSDSIYFSMADTIGFWSDTTSNTGGWDGIHIENNSGAVSKFEYCNMAFGKQYYSFPNYPEYMGGALLRIKNYGGIYLNNNLLHNNMLCHDYGVEYSHGSGVFCQNVDTVTIIENFFFKNRSFKYGGAISILDGCPNTLISHNTFVENVAYFIYHGPGWATAGGVGGAIHCSDGFDYSPTIINNVCHSNISPNAIIYTCNLLPIICNNLIYNNGSSGAGRYSAGILDGHNLGHGYISNNTIVNNYSSTGISLFSKALVFNNIVWGNKKEGYDIDNQIFIFDFEHVDPTLFNNCIEYGPGGTDSITAYPDFTNPTEGAGIEYDNHSVDWTLLDSSPCINTGTPDTTGLNLPEFDIAGNPRIFGGRIDMGAYENQSVYVKINDSPVYSKIKLYPNPGTDKIYIDIPPDIDGTWIDIVDGQGRVMMHEQIRYDPAILSPYKLIAGIYFYRIYNENKVIKSGKWVKR